MSVVPGQRDVTYLPCRACCTVVRIFSLHGSVNFADRKTLFRTAEDCTSENDWKSVLWATVGVWEAI